MEYSFEEGPSIILNKYLEVKNDGKIVFASASGKYRLDNSKEKNRQSSLYHYCVLYLYELRSFQWSLVIFFFFKSVIVCKTFLVFFGC